MYSSELFICIRKLQACLPFQKCCSSFMHPGWIWRGKRRERSSQARGRRSLLSCCTNFHHWQTSFVTEEAKLNFRVGDKSDCEFLFVSEQNGEKVSVRRSVLLVCLLSMSWSCREQCTGKTAHYGRWERGKWRKGGSEGGRSLMRPRECV